MTVENVAAPSDAALCSFTDSGNEIWVDMFLDVANQLTSAMYLRVINRLVETTVELNSNDPVETLRIPNGIRPTRFEYRWECDSRGFTGDVGPMFVPAFSVSRPFCFDERDDATNNFVGFDIIDASGPMLRGEDPGLVKIRPITAQLGQGIRDVFNLAAQAQACCDDAGTCEDLVNFDVAASPPCDALQRTFNAITPIGETPLSANNPEDVNRWFPFSVYTVQGALGTSYPMRLVGRLEGETETGRLVRSAEFSTQFNFCSGCGVSTACTDL